MRLVVFAFTAIVLSGPLARAEAQTLKVGYDISLAGLTLGTADLSSTFDGPKYSMQAAVKLSGLAKMLTGGKGAATAAGAISGARPQPTAFAVTSRSSSDERTVRMGLASGNVEAVEINPPIDEKADRVPVKDGDKKGVVDPVSALLMPGIQSGKLLDSTNCNRTIPIFDGAARFNVVLSYDSTRNVDKPGYKGPVLVCKARYIPISGHRALRPSTKFMQENKDMSVWLAPLEAQRVLVPIRISVRTMIGTSVVEASRWSLEGESKIVPISLD